MLFRSLNLLLPLQCVCARVTVYGSSPQLQRGKQDDWPSPRQCHFPIDPSSLVPLPTGGDIRSVYVSLTGPLLPPGGWFWACHCATRLEFMGLYLSVFYRDWVMSEFRFCRLTDLSLPLFFLSLCLSLSLSLSVSLSLCLSVLAVWGVGGRGDR